jgi:hypothetical protein
MLPIQLVPNHVAVVAIVDALGQLAPCWKVDLWLWHNRVQLPQEYLSARLGLDYMSGSSEGAQKSNTRSCESAGIVPELDREALPEKVSLRIQKGILTY